MIFRTMKKICIATGTRAEWGLLSPVAALLRSNPDVELQIVATNMHLDPRFGHTIDEISAAGFNVDRRVPIHSSSPDPDSHKENALQMSRCLAGMTDALAELRPDILLILGDRFEMLATASAAMMLGIPIAHIHGGEATVGALDDSIRHAITKLASLHLTATESYRRRVIQMGEDPRMVINVGAPGVYNALNIAPLSAEQLAQSIGLRPDRRTILLTYHPATLDPVDPAIRFKAVLEAVSAIPDIKVIITYPNNDARSARLIEMIREFASANPSDVVAIPSLGMQRYISALHHVGAVVGNSSSGIIEVPSVGIPTVDIGTRQLGRDRSDSVISCGESPEEIRHAIEKALSPEMQRLARAVENPYFKPDTPQLIVDALMQTDLTPFPTKRFNDLQWTDQHSI